MGIGDKIMAIGDAWALYCKDASRGSIAIGDGAKIDGSDISLHEGLDFLVSPEQLAHLRDTRQVEPLWIKSFPGYRPYIDYEEMRRQLGSPPETTVKRRKLVGMLGRYCFISSYRAKPAPLKLTPNEEETYAALTREEPYVVMEPYIKARAPLGKQWPVERYLAVAQGLKAEGLRVVQIGDPSRPPLDGFERKPTQSFRDALPILKASRLYIGPEGALHHASAATRNPAIVIFGGFTSPRTTGYAGQISLTGGAEACGTSEGRCRHCIDAMNAIGVDEVLAHAQSILKD